MENFLSTKDSLDTADVIQFNDYTGTREEFWRETFVVVTLNVSMINKNICSILKSYQFYLLSGYPETSFDN